jgi:hypothetical protein
MGEIKSSFSTSKIKLDSSNLFKQQLNQGIVLTSFSTQDDINSSTRSILESDHV